MKLLVIDLVDYVDYPTGGVVAFYRAMLPSCGSSLFLAGITTDKQTQVGLWTKRTLYGIKYDYYSLAYVEKKSNRPIVPARISGSFLVKKHIKNIIATAPKYDVIFTQSPEVLYCIPEELLNITCFLSPGLGNPLDISRYAWARRLAKIYDKYYLMPKVSKVRWLLAAADRNSMEDFASRSNGLVPANKIISFPTRYNDACLSVKNQELCRRKIGIDKKYDLFVTVGRLNWFKGWKLMVDAFDIYQRQHKDATLVFIGDGEERQKIQDYVKGIGIDGKVLLVGKKNPEEISIYLNAASVFVMGSFSEGWSTTLVEACACGVPCVVTNFSSAKEMIIDGENGYVVDTRSPEDFENYMTKSINLDRSRVREFDKKYEYLAQSRIKEELGKILIANE